MSVRSLADPNTQWVLAGCLFLGVGSGVLGSFAMLRRRSLLGDALAHAALPGVCLAFLLTGSRSLGPLLMGALFAGVVGAYFVQTITRNSRIKEDAALALVLSIFFGFGVVLLTIIQHSGSGGQSGLDKYLFGQAASLIGNDVRIMAACAFLVCILAVLLFKEFKLLCFDPEFARGLGYSTNFLDSLLMFLIVLVVVIGMQAVGVIMMAAMLITPAAAARLWTDHLKRLVVLAGMFGALAGIVGTLVSTTAFRMPTGPLIVLSATGIFLVSLTFAPRRGILSRLARRTALRAKVARENVLRSFYELAEPEGAWNRSVTLREVASDRGKRPRDIAGPLARLARRGLVSGSKDAYRLTEAGREAAYRIVRNHRLWEMFLMYEGNLDADHVDRDADMIEHHLSPKVVRELERLLAVHGRELKLPSSVHPVRRIPA